MKLHASIALALLCTSAAACGGGSAPADDGGGHVDAASHDAGGGIDAPGTDGGADGGAPDAATIDVGTDAFVALDAAPPFDPACIPPALAMAADADVPIPSVSGSSGSLMYTSCPSGSDATAAPKLCIEETRLGMATLTPSVTASQVTLTGTMPFRAQDVAVNVNVGVCTRPITFATNGDGACPGGSYDSLPISIDVVVDTAHENALQLNMVFDDAAVGANLTSSTQLCGVSACSGPCCISDACACALAGIADWSSVRTPVLSSMMSTLRTALAAQIESQICATAPCASGFTADADGICRNASMACAPSPSLYRSGC
jgi:hypothetical protein